MRNAGNRADEYRLAAEFCDSLRTAPYNGSVVTGIPIPPEIASMLVVDAVRVHGEDTAKVMEFVASHVEAAERITERMFGGARVPGNLQYTLVVLIGHDDYVEIAEHFMLDDGGFAADIVAELFTPGGGK